MLDIKRIKFDIWNKMIINKTPYPVNVICSTRTITFPKDEDPISLSSEIEQIASIDGIPVYKEIYRSSNMPEYVEGVVYIVSAMVVNAYPHRYDLVYPYDVVRDDDGYIIGCRGFAQ
jgi:hypothetical protein